MEHVLVVGTDTVVGANVAARLTNRNHVVGVSANHAVSIEGCENTVLAGDNPIAVRQALATYRPARVAICGVTGDSPWHEEGAWVADPNEIAVARTWADASRDFGVPLTLLSSDAVFTGPWMFHKETSSSLCASPKAQALRTLESQILEDCPGSLVVRTHAYGWSPLFDQSGWIEGMLAALECGAASTADCLSHATPILATDLAEILERAWSAGLSGPFHVAGAERTNGHRFLSVLATVFELNPPSRGTVRASQSAARGFAAGEMSLHTRCIGRALGMSMPILLEGLQRLKEQHSDGFDGRLRGTGRTSAPQVA